MAGYSSHCLTQGVHGQGNWKIQNEYMYMYWGFQVFVIIFHYTVLQWTEANNSYLLSVVYSSCVFWKIQNEYMYMYLVFRFLLSYFIILFCNGLKQITLTFLVLYIVVVYFGDLISFSFFGWRNWEKLYTVHFSKALEMGSFYYFSSPGSENHCGYH